MSILIKGMEMPTRCGRCDLRVKEADGDIDYHYACCITAAAIDNLGEKMDDCPLAPVPPHGRCIDADANIAVMRRVLDAPYTSRGTIDTAMLKACIKMFEEAPTVLEPEEGE
jgi:hypothetical protein